MAFKVEYGRSVSKCKKCESPINKGLLRIGKHQKADTFDGELIVWFHAKCFLKMANHQKTLSITDFENFQLINFEDQVKLLTALGIESPLHSERTYQDQCLKFEGIRMQLVKKGVKMKELESLLMANGQFVSKGIYELRLSVADMLTFGALATCEKCCIGRFKFRNTGYACQEKECHNEVTYPERLPYRIPTGIKEKYPFLGNINYALSYRILLQQSTMDTQSSEQNTSTFGSLDNFKKLFTSKKQGTIYVCGDEKFSVWMIRTDVETGKNSFYKLQILVTEKQSFIVFRAWGRIGTLRGDSKEILTDNAEEAIKIFKQVYFKQTENEWDQRNFFVKKLLRYSPLDVEEDFEEFEKLPNQQPESKLPVPIQHLIKLLFDEEKMKATMLQDMKIDVEKLPLGKLSDVQIRKATAVLFELQSILNHLSTNSTINNVIKATNRFYELVPHNFGDSKPEILDNKEKVFDKLKTLEELRFICFTFDLRKNLQAMNHRHDIDILYENLKVSMDVLADDSAEYMKLQKYVDETSCNDNPDFVKDKDSLIGMKVKNIFKITREGDGKAEEPEDLQRMLLWHGSPMPNYVNILKNGLKIAPFGVKRIGRDLGDGIYLADLFSYSAYYCRPRQLVTHCPTTYMLLLCEATVGNIKMFHDRNEELPVGLSKDFHSVMGVGKFGPTTHDLLDQVKFSCGKIEKQEVKTYFTCNEYVVYRDDQVKLKYLVEVERNLMA